MSAAKTVLERGPSASRLRAALVVLCVLAGIAVALAATAWFSAGPLIVMGAKRAPIDQGGGYLIVGEGGVSVADNGWRPASLRLDAVFDSEAPRHVRITGPDGFLATHETQGREAHLVIDLDPLAPRPRYTLEIEVTSLSGAPDALRLGEPRVVADVFSWQGLAVAWMGAVAGVLAWLALAGAAPARAFRDAIGIPGGGLVAAAGLVPAAAVLPVVGLQHPTTLVQAPLFGLNLLVLIVAGRVMRRWADRVLETSTRAGAPFQAMDPATGILADLIAGIVGLAIALAWYSLVLKRVAGIDRAPLAVFLVVAALTLTAMATHGVLWGRSRDDAARERPLLTPGEAALVAVLVFGLCAIGGPHLATLNAYSTDPDQHVGWTAQLLAHGLVPDRYFASGLHIDYPLGLHALAAVLSLFGVLPPGTAVAMLPVVASFVSLALLVLGAGRLVREPAAWTVREWLAALLGIAAMSVALSSSQFSIWQAYQGTGRLAAGLVQVVPLLVLIAAVAPQAGSRSPAPREVEAVVDASAAGAVRGAGGGLLLSGVVVCLAGAVALWLNPGLVPLQALLSVLALVVALIQARGLLWGRRVAMLAGGLAVGASLASAILAADPWVYRRLLRLGGRDVASAAVLDRAIAHHNSELTARSCLTWECIAAALSLERALEHAKQPWLVVALGPLDVARCSGEAAAEGEAAGPARAGPYNRPDTGPDTGPSAKPSNGPSTGRDEGRAAAPVRRFPDVTNRGHSPHHGRSHITFALTMAGLVPLLVVPRGRRVAFVLVALLVVASLDVVIGEHLHRLIDPGDAALKLLPPYVSRNGARLLTQAFWATAFGAVGFAAAGLAAGTWAGARRRLARAVGVVCLAAWAILAGWTTFDAGQAVWSGMTRIGLPLRHLRPGDLRDAASLVADHVPEGESLLTPAQHVVINGRHWLFPGIRLAHDLVGPLHLQARRASLFLYQFEHGARVSPFDYLDACREFEAGSLPRVVRETRARWALEVAGPTPLRTRSLCHRPVSSLFPEMRVAAERGRVKLWELWQ